MRSRKRIAELEKRFPGRSGLEDHLRSDQSSSPTPSHEVQKTLVEAFVLVVLVVFLFLGSVRATLIPTLAVPVSLIGTFIVLLAVGYSANTVSLLAIVLAIGIVVDDAIVVVENVERVMEEHPELSPAEATKQAMARDHRADHRHHAGAALGVRAGRVHSRHFRRIVPAVRGDGRGGDVPVGDQRADAVAGAVRRAAAPASRTAARPHRLGHARRSTGCATPMAPWSRGSSASRSSGWRWSRLRPPASSALAKITPTGFLPEDDQGAFFVVVQLPGGASVGRTTEVIGQAEAMLQRGAGGRRYHLGRRAELHRQLFAAECRLHGRDAQAVRGAQGRRRRRCGADRPAGAEIPCRFRAAPWSPLAPPPILGLGTGGGFSLRAAGSARRRSRRRWRRCCAG